MSHRTQPTSTRQPSRALRLRSGTYDGERVMKTTHALVVSLLLLPVAEGCGGSDAGSSPDAKDASSTSTLDMAFVERAETACAPYADYQAKTVLNLEKFNRYAPDPALLPQVAAHLEQHPAYKSLVSDLEALGAPKSGGTAWDAVVADFRENAQAVQDGIDAARTSDPARFTDFVGRLEQDKTQLFRDLQVAGLGGSSCAGAEVDPLKPPVPDH